MINEITPNIYTNIELLQEDLGGWNGNSPLFKTLIQQTLPKTIIEVGTWKGQSAINMGTVVKELELPTKIYCVDTWLGALEFWTWGKTTTDRDLKLKNGYPQIYYQFLSNVVHKKLQDVILPFPTTSNIAARFFKETGIQADLIYIDGSHDEEDVYLDIKNYHRLLNSNGIIFGDDYVWDSVRIAVDRYVMENSLVLEIIDGFWIIKNV